MVLPLPRSQDADAGGLGRLDLSPICENPALTTTKVKSVRRAIFLCIDVSFDSSRTEILKRLPVRRFLRSDWTVPPSTRRTVSNRSTLYGKLRCTENADRSYWGWFLGWRRAFPVMV